MAPSTSTFRRIPLGPSLTVDAPAGWQDVSEAPEASAGSAGSAGASGAVPSSYALARIGDDPSRGVGTLQVSPPLARPPGPPLDGPRLVAMAEEFGESNSLGLPFDRAALALDGAPTIGAASFHRDEDFVRVWFVAHGRRMTIVTYVAEAGAAVEELAECETIVRTLRFSGA